MEKAKFYKRTLPAMERVRFITDDESLAIEAVNRIATRVAVTYYNEAGTILMVEVDIEGVDNHKAINAIFADAGFSTDLDTMLRKA